MIDSETRQMEEMIKAATEMHPSIEDYDSDEAIAQRYLEEQAALQQHLLEEREQLLRSLSLASTMTDVTAVEEDLTEAGDLNNEELQSVIQARYAIRMRLLTMESRLDFAELQLKFDKEAAAVGSRGDQMLHFEGREAPAEAEEMLSVCRRRRLSLIDEEKAYAKLCADADREIETMSSIVNDGLSVLEKRLQGYLESRSAYYEESCSTKVATMSEYSINFEQSDRESVLLRIEEECNKIRDLNQTLNEKDLRVFQCESQSIKDILQYGKVWRKSSDYKAWQTSLRTRAIAGEYFELDMLKRAAVIEELFNREAVLLRTSMDLIQRGANRSEIEMEFSNVNSKAKESSLAMLKELEASKRNDIEAVMRHQASTEVGFEEEYAAAVETDCHRSILIVRQISDSRHRAWSGLRNAVEEKKTVLRERLAADKKPFILQTYLTKQMDYELIREELELRSVYQDLVEIQSF